MNESTLPTSGIVLVVEDDDQIRQFIRTLLSKAGYTVLEARTGTDAIDVAREQTGPVDLLLADMLLPELSGYDVACTLRQTWPDLKILFMTGYVEGDIVQRCVGELNAAFLDKPFQPANLLDMVRRTIGSPAEHTI